LGSWQRKQGVQWAQKTPFDPKPFLKVAVRKRSVFEPWAGDLWVVAMRVWDEYNALKHDSQ